MRPLDPGGETGGTEPAHDRLANQEVLPPVEPRNFVEDTAEGRPSQPSILSRRNTTGLMPSVQQTTMVFSLFIQQPKFPPKVSVMQHLWMSFHAHSQNPSG